MLTPPNAPPDPQNNLPTVTSIVSATRSTDVNTIRRTPRRWRLPTLLLSFTLLSATITIALLGATTPKAADAICRGAGNPAAVYTYDANSNLVAEEALTWPGNTCNNDYTYQGAVLDPITDGSCAYAYYLEPLAYYALQGASCTTGAWNFYTYNDTIGANSVYVSVRPSYLNDSWILSSGY